MEGVKGENEEISITNTHEIKIEDFCVERDLIEVKKEREEQIEVEDQQPYQTPDVLMTSICLKTENNFSEEITAQGTEEGNTVQETDGQNPLKCKRCGKCFRYRGYLENHMSVHNEEEFFVCLQCERRFKHKESLVKHMAVHTTPKPFKCQHCGSTFKYLRRLTEHTEVHNQGVFTCQHCKRQFKCTKSLKSHMVTHSKARPFTCPQCGNTFKNRGSLINHMGRHTDERPFKCQCCGRGFKYKGRLDIHITEGCADFKRINKRIFLNEESYLI